MLPVFRHIPPMMQLAVASAMLLGGALVAQYGFGMRPCHVCLWQRVPYGVLMGLGALSLLLPSKNGELMRMLGWLAIAALGVEVALALYHSGVERHIFTGPTDCTTSFEAGQSLDALRAQILGAAVVRCDEPAWMLPGLLSMANANLIAALALLVYAWRNRPMANTGANQ